MPLNDQAIKWQVKFRTKKCKLRSVFKKKKTQPNNFDSVFTMTGLELAITTCKSMFRSSLKSK